MLIVENMKTAELRSNSTFNTLDTDSYFLISPRPLETGHVIAHAIALSFTVFFFFLTNLCLGCENRIVVKTEWTTMHFDYFLPSPEIDTTRR